MSTVNHLNALISRALNLPPQTMEADIELRPGETPLVRIKLMVETISADGSVALEEVAKSYRLVPIEGDGDV